VVGETPNVCSYFDIPLQHAGKNVLSRMRRGGSREHYERLIDRLRDKVPGAAVRTTFIVGFPGETEDDFQELLDFVRRIEFDRVGVFTYSDEEKSPAFDLAGKVDPGQAKQRERSLMTEQARISRRKNRLMKGNRVRVLLEGRSRESDLLLEGRMESQAPEIDGCVLINDVPSGTEPRPGDFVTVQITGAHEYDLIGHVV
jgi:ribosomal protein S12 methylthiotransferase